MAIPFPFGQPDESTSISRDNDVLPPRNWPALLMFVITLAIATSLIPWYGILHGYSLAGWASDTRQLDYGLRTNIVD